MQGHGDPLLDPRGCAETAEMSEDPAAGMSDILEQFGTPPPGA